MIIIKRVFTFDGVSKAELMEHQETGKIYFRQYFETHGFNSLDFNSIDEMITYLDSKHPDAPKIVVCGDKLYYPLSEGDRTLTYFGTIKE